MKSMKKPLIKSWTFIFLFLILCSFSYNDKKGKEEDVKIKEAYQKLEEAVKLRKFSDAKVVVNEIIPWMKQDIKDDKKTLTQIGKSIDESELDKKSFSTTLGKKNKLYQSTKKLVESSPAAIRVKGSDLVKLVNEYMLLIE